MARMQLSGDDLRRYAELGAAARLEEIERERAEIIRAFPSLVQARLRRSKTGGNAAVSDAAAATDGRRRGRMSAAARKAVSARMKKYWAGRRKSKAAAN